MNLISRYLTESIRADALALGKMAFLSGPRQTGKTTIGRLLLAHPENEFTWDDEDFRKTWIRSPAQAIAARETGPILLDEIHKDPRWKQKLKGLYDTSRQAYPIVVTGSAFGVCGETNCCIQAPLHPCPQRCGAPVSLDVPPGTPSVAVHPHALRPGRIDALVATQLDSPQTLDVFRKGGDSLLGRFLPYHVHPFTVGETAGPPSPDEIFSRTAPTFPLADVLRLGGFPEPLLGGSEALARRWSRLRRERLIAQDVRDLRNIQNLRALDLLVDLLPSRVGSLLSVNSLRQDLGVAHDTIAAWLDTLAAVYLCFRIKPWSKKVSRAVRAEPKLYLFDLTQVPEGGPRLENLVALHLLKACDFWTDTAQGEFALHFLRTRDGQEIDFLVARDGAPWMLVEVKSNDARPAQPLARWAAELGTPLNYQLVTRPGFRKNYPDAGVTVLSTETFLAGLV